MNNHIEDFTNRLCVIFHVNDYCNFKCIYCCSNIPYLPNNTHKDINVYKLSLVINQIKKNISPDFFIKYVIIGGEPLVYKDIIKFISILEQDTHAHSITILTNASFDMSDSFKQIKNIFFTISYHYDVLTNNSRDKYFATLLNNIDFLSQNNYCKLNVISLNKLDNYIIDNILLKYKLVNHNPDIHYRIVIARTTPFYTTQSKEKYINPHFNQSDLYIYRSIKVDMDYNFYYGCEIANKVAIIPQYCESVNLQYSHAWQIIKNNLFKKHRCTSQLCDCPLCIID